MSLYDAQSTSEQTVADFDGDYRYSGRQKNLALQINRVLHRSETHKTILGYGLLLNEAQQFINGAHLDVQHRRTSEDILIHADVFSNDSGYLRAGNSLLLTGAHRTSNRSGQLLAGQELRLLTASLDNSRGRVQAVSDLTLDMTGRLNNQQGSIAAHQTRIQSAAFDNTAGSALAASDLTLKVTDQLNNQRGTISSGGSVILAAGGDLNIRGSDLTAVKDIRAGGKNITVTAGEEAQTALQTREFHQSGLTTALSGTAGSALNALVQGIQEQEEEQDGRLRALKTLKTALSGAQAVQHARLAQTNPADNNATGVSISYGSQSSKSEQRTGSGALLAGPAGKTTAENNSLTGDKVRESLKQGNEWWKQKVRNTLGENLVSQVTNGILNAVAETGDVALFAGDSVFDATATVVTCGLGDSYCQQANISDLNKKDQVVSNAVKVVSNAVNALTSGEI